MNYIVEHLTSDDYIWAVEVAAIRMITEEVKRPELIHRPQLYALVDKMIADGTALIAKCDGEPVGAISGLLMPNPLNPTISTLAEIIWYVLPEYRKTRIGGMLLSAYMELGDEVADEYTLCLLEDSPINHSSLINKGFVKAETAFIKQSNKEI